MTFFLVFFCKPSGEKEVRSGNSPFYYDELEVAGDGGGGVEHNRERMLRESVDFFFRKAEQLSRLLS